MATDGHVQIETEIDTSGLEQGLSQAQQSTRKTFEQLAQESGKTVEELVADAKRIAEEYQAQGVDIPNSYKKAYRDMGVDAQSARETMARYAEETGESYEESSEQAHSSWKEALSGIGTLAQKGFDIVSSAAKTVVNVAVGAITAAGTAVAGIGAYAIKVGGDFEAGMSKVEAISGATGEELEELTDKAKEMGAKTKFSATESAAAFEYMAMAGWKAEDMLNGIEGIMNLAAASGEDLALTSDIVTDAMTGFGLAVDGSTTILKNGMSKDAAESMSALGMATDDTTDALKDGFSKEVSNATHFADVLAAASSSANTNVAMMGETFKYVAPLAGAMGYSAEDTALAVGLMANSGIKAGQAGTSLRAALTNLISPSDSVAEAMQNVGLYATEMQTTFDQSKIDKQMAKVEKATASVMTAQEAYNKAVEKYGAESTQAEAKALSLSAAQTNLAQAQQTLSSLQSGTTEEVALYNEAIENEDGTVKSLAETLDFLREKMGGMSEAEQSAAASAIFGKEAMSGMLAIINASDEDYVKLTESIANCDGAAENMANTMNDNLQGQLTLLSSATEGFGVAVYEHLQTPLTDLVKIGQEAMTELTLAFEGGGTRRLINAGARIFTNLLQGAAEQAPALIDMAVAIVSKFLSKLEEKAPELLSAGISILNSLVQGILTVVPQIGSLALTVISYLANTLIEQAPQIITTGTEMLVNLMNGISSYLPNVVEKGKEIITSVVTGIAENLPTLVQSAIDLVLNFALSLVDMLPTIIDCGIELLLALAQGIADSLPELIEKVPAIINNFMDAINEALPKILEAGIQILLTLGKGIIDSIPIIIDNAWEIVKAIINVITLVNLASLGKNLITGLGNGIKSKFGNIGTIAKDLIQKLKNPFHTDWAALGRNALNGIKNGITSKVSKIVDAIKQLITKIKHPFDWDWRSIGDNVVTGIKNGILGAISGLAEAAVQAAQSALNAVKDFFGIHSPSRVMRDVIGKNMIAGMTVGIEAETPNLEKTSTETANRAVEAMQGVSASEVVSNFQVQSHHVVDTIASASAQQAIFSDTDKNSNFDKIEFDYEEMGKQTAKALHGTMVTIDGQRVGTILTPYVNSNMNDTATLQERGVI